MKTKSLILLLVVSLVVGCKQNNKALGDDVPPQYLLALEFVDQAGNNISQIAGNNAAVEIIYTDNGIELYNPSLYALKSDDGVWRSITFGVGQFEDHDLKTLSLTWKINSKAIFGDQEFRLIQTNWSYYNYYPNRCESLVFEGETYHPELKNGEWTARVVINR